MRKYQEDIKANVSKIDLKSVTTSNAVGVFKYGTCGSYATVEIYMDCEDGSSSFSRIEGNPGSSFISGSSGGNATLYFCVVDGSLFNQNGQNYGVLSLHSGYLKSGVSKYWRHFDNEDGGNNNHMTASYNVVGDRTSQGGDTELYFDLFQATKATSTPNYFPDLGISYGVLGYNINSFSSDIKNYSDPFNLMVCTANTGIAISQVK